MKTKSLKKKITIEKGNKSIKKSKDFDFGSKEILETAKEILEKKDICDNCLGRQFGALGHGFTNKQRAQKILENLKTKRKDVKYCEVCDNLFSELDEIANKTIDKLKVIEFKTFVVGTKLSTEIILREETLWEEISIENCEPIKSELNRELGKLISKKLEAIKKGIEVDEELPDVVVLLDTEEKNTRLSINPLFVYGGYKKFERGLPQTKWETYKETVEDLIAIPFMRDTQGAEHALHGMGREDRDARCLDWRPFVFEVVRPKKRNLDLDKIKKEINKSGKIEVSDLRFSNKEEVREVKAAKPDKTYRLLVSFEKPLTEKDLQKLKQLKGKTIKQQTPTRVLHRRADKTRPRKVKEITWKVLDKNKVEFEVKGEAGLYAKELVHGDQGRTKPSIAEILDNPGKIEELDVIKIWVKK